jgi:hypothetical protein
MKFRMAHLGYRQTPDYPWDVRIELIEYNTREREDLSNWLEDLKIPHITAGWNTGSVIYLKAKHATWFTLKWT